LLLRAVGIDVAATVTTLVNTGKGRARPLHYAPFLLGYFAAQSRECAADIFAPITVDAGGGCSALDRLFIIAKELRAGRSQPSPGRP